jgi:hypothetical protein
VWGATRDTVVEALQSDRPILLILNGDVEDAATRILTGSEYDAHCGDLIGREAAMKPLSRLIQRVLESRRVPCVGCSLQDDRIVTILNNAASRMDACPLRNCAGPGLALERITERYTWGDLTREAYDADRDRLHADLSTVREANDSMSLITRAAAFLRDLTSDWAAATPDQRNALARLNFKKVEVEDDRVAAVVPKPDFAPIFVLTKDNEKGWLDAATPKSQLFSLAGGSDGDRTRTYVMSWMAPSSSPWLQNVAWLGCPGAKAINVPVRTNSRSKSGTPSVQRLTAGDHFAILPQLTGFLTRPSVLSCANSVLLRWWSAQEPQGETLNPRLAEALQPLVEISWTKTQMVRQLVQRSSMYIVPLSLLRRSSQEPIL